MNAPFRTRPGVSASIGAAHTGLVPLLNASGVLDRSFFELNLWGDRVYFGGTYVAPHAYWRSFGGLSFGLIEAATSNILIEVNASGTLTVEGISVNTSVNLPANVITRVNLSDGAATSVIGRAAGSSGAVADIVASTADSALTLSSGTLAFRKISPVMLNTTGTLSSATVLRGDGAWSNSVSGSWTVTNSLTVSSGTVTLPANTVARAALAHGTGLSVIGRSSSITGTVTDIAAVGDGDSLFVENTTLVFDSYIRKRRNIMQGFWEFEAGATGWTTSGQPLPGTPFIGFTTGVSAISGVNRATALTRNCLTLVCAGIGRAAFTMGDAAPVGAPGLTTGIGPLFCEVGLNINMLSTAPEEHTFNVGFVCDDAIGDDGVFFQYQRSSTPNWRLVARSGGITTVTNTTTAVAIGGVRLRIEITTASLATFYINGTSVGTVTSNIPVRVGLGAVLEKSVHAAAVVFHDIDYIAYQLALTTPRSATQR